MAEGGAAEGKPSGIAVHATAVAIADRALLILGPSGCGKSHLAFELIAASSRQLPIRLVGDDRVILTPRSFGLVASSHPRIAGFIERRGLGIVAMDFVTSAPLAAMVNLGRTTLPTVLTRDPPGLPCVSFAARQSVVTARCVLGWWRDACTTHPAKPLPAGSS